MALRFSVPLVGSRLFFFLLVRPPPRSPLFPYTTLFRSRRGRLPRRLRAHGRGPAHAREPVEDRKSTRLNSSHRTISYAVFCLKKKKGRPNPTRITSKQRDHLRTSSRTRPAKRRRKCRRP